MPTLYVENVPEDLYGALRGRAKQHRTSISAEVLALLAENVSTPREVARRRALVQRMRTLRAQQPAAPGPFASTEEMLREDRSR